MAASEPWNIGKRHAAAAHMHAAEFGAVMERREHLAGIEQPLFVKSAFDALLIGNAVLRAALYMPAMSAMRYNPAIVALVARLKSPGRLKPKQIVVAAMRKLLVLCFGVLKTGKPFDPAIAMGC
jgi:hypothetical protein